MKYLTNKETKSVSYEGKEVELTAYTAQSPTEELYFLQPPPEKTTEGQVKQLIIKMFLQIDAEYNNRLKYHFSPHEFFKVQGVNCKTKTMMQSKLKETLSYFPSEKVKLHIEDIREYINTYTPTSEKIKRMWAETFGEVTPEQFGQIIAEVYNKAKSETEQDYTSTFESVKYWLIKEGRILPKDFNDFWNWFVSKYSDDLDEGITQVTREHILNFCKETETKLTEPTVRTNSTETTEQKIKRILEPLQEAFDTPGHLDLIVKALAEYSDTGNLPVKAERKIIQKDNRDFYPYFKKLKNETRLTVPGIASVLVYFIWQNNGSGGLISPGTIEKNIKQNYPKL